MRARLFLMCLVCLSFSSSASACGGIENYASDGFGDFLPQIPLNNPSAVVNAVQFQRGRTLKGAYLPTPAQLDALIDATGVKDSGEINPLRRALASRYANFTFQVLSTDIQAADQHAEAIAQTRHLIAIYLKVPLERAKRPRIFSSIVSHCFHSLLILVDAEERAQRERAMLRDFRSLTFSLRESAKLETGKADRALNHDLALLLLQPTDIEAAVAGDSRP